MIDTAIISSEDNQTLGIVYWNTLHIDKDSDGKTITLTFDGPIGFVPYEIYYVEVLGVVKFKGRLSSDRTQIVEVDYNYESTRIKETNKRK